MRMKLSWREHFANPLPGGTQTSSATDLSISRSHSPSVRSTLCSAAAAACEIA
jgi:hypothetical protein